MDNKDSYSFDEERYYSGDLDEAVQDFIESGYHIGNEECSLHMGVSIEPKLEQCISLVDIDNSVDEVYGEYGDIAADNFSDAFTYDIEKSLREHVRKAIKEWRIENNFSVGFFTVEDVVEIKFKVINDETYEYEVINEH